MDPYPPPRGRHLQHHLSCEVYRDRATIIGPSASSNQIFFKYLFLEKLEKCIEVFEENFKILPSEKKMFNFCSSNSKSGSTLKIYHGPIREY
jgi:hypothetical protein